MAKFVLEIETGNDAMQTGADIAGALTKLAGKINPDFKTDGETLPRPILDDNGNRVGYYQIRRGKVSEEKKNG
jgi:hypothetical protein